MRVTALLSMDPVLRDLATFSVLADATGTVVVRHDLGRARSAGVLRRVVSDVTGVLEDEEVPLDHPCMGCAMREDLLPTLLRLESAGRWQHALVALPVAGEAVPVVQALLGGEVDGRPVRHLLPWGGAVAVLDGGTAREDLFGDDLLAERGLAHTDDDRRSVGEVLARQLEHADLVLVDDDHVPPVVLPLLQHLAPAGASVRTGLHELPGRALLDLQPGSDTARRGDPRHVRPAGRPDAGEVWTLDLATWRPLHPERLRHEIEALACGELRGRGRFWLPGRPSRVAAWDGGGGQLSIGDVGSWDGAQPSTRLVVTGLGQQLREQVAASFERVVLTDAELARGLASWVGRADGFDDWLGEREDAA
jgi:G3E family GTPase